MFQTAKLLILNVNPDLIKAPLPDHNLPWERDSPEESKQC